MALFWIGLMESLAAALVGTWLYLSMPAYGQIWGEGLWGLAVLSLILTAAFGRGGPRAPEMDVAEPPREALDESPQEHATPALPLPPADESVPTSPLAVSVAELLPGSLGQIQWDVLRAGWRVRAVEAGALLADMGSGGDVPGRRVSEMGRRERRMADHLILEQGFRALAEGTPPQFDLTAVAEAFTPEQIQARLEDLEEEEEDLRRSADRWQRIEPDLDSRDALAFRIRWEHLAELKRQWEALYLLKRGYETLRDQGGTEAQS